MMLIGRDAIRNRKAEMEQGDDAFLNLQRVSACPSVPADSQMKNWINYLLQLTDNKSKSLTVRIVDEAEIRALNARYRALDKPTNVLSFPSELPVDIEPDYLGDLVICASVVEGEARAQGKPIEAHWAHMLVHGLLHLLGYDHLEDDQAERMEAFEIRLLRALGFKNPYAVG